MLPRTQNTQVPFLIYLKTSYNPQGALSSLSFDDFLAFFPLFRTISFTGAFVHLLGITGRYWGGNGTTTNNRRGKTGHWMYRKVFGLSRSLPIFPVSAFLLLLPHVLPCLGRSIAPLARGVPSFFSSPIDYSFFCFFSRLTRLVLKRSLSLSPFLHVEQPRQ